MLFKYLLVMLLLEDAVERPALSAPWPFLAAGQMSTTMPTVLLGSDERGAGVAWKPRLGLVLITKDSGLEAM